MEETAVVFHHLPVKIKNNPTCPQFHSLLSKLSTKLGEESAKILATKKTGTEIARKKYLTQKLKLEAVNELILKHEIESVQSSQEAKLVQRLRELVGLAEVQGMLDLGQIGEQKVTTLGLKPQSISYTENRQHLVQMVPLLEDFLFERCSSVYTTVKLDGDLGTNRSLLHPHIVRLPDKIQDLIEEEKKSRRELRELREDWEEVYLKQLKVLNQIVLGVEVMVKKFYTGSKLDSNSIHIQYQQAKCEALVLKLQCLHMEIINSTYTRDTIKAISKMRTRLLEQICEAQTLLTSLETTLDQYRNTGPEFSDIVKEYAGLQKEIDGKKWALKQLKQNNQ